MSKLSAREHSPVIRQFSRPWQHEAGALHRGMGSPWGPGRSWPWASAHIMGAKCLKRPWRRCASTRFRPGGAVAVERRRRQIDMNRLPAAAKVTSLLRHLRQKVASCGFEGREPSAAFFLPKSLHSSRIKLTNRQVCDQDRDIVARSQDVARCRKLLSPRNSMKP